MGSNFWKIDKCVPGRPSLHREMIPSESELNLSCIVEDYKLLSFDKDVKNNLSISDDSNGFTRLKNNPHGGINILSDFNHGAEHGPQCLPSSNFESSSLFDGSLTNNPLELMHAEGSTTDNLDAILNHPHTGGNALKHETKGCKFQAIVQEVSLKLDDLRKLSWSGVPPKARPLIWKLLCNYLPLRKDWRQTVIDRKRLDYMSLVKQYIEAPDKTNEDIYKQISIDVPRMIPSSALFQQQTIQDIFLRILFIWAIRHPASGYVQGMNDLVTPFFIVFLGEGFPSFGGGPSDSVDINNIPEEMRNEIEADTFWCFSKFMEGIQDNYVFAQMGIQQKVEQLKVLIQRVDGTLHTHLQNNGLDYLQFSFRWMNNLLTRELPLCCCVRLWDTFLAESSDCSKFQLYVYAAFLLHWREDLLKQKDFQGLMSMLQNLPSRSWIESDIDVLMAEAYSLKSIFSND